MLSPEGGQANARKFLIPSAYVASSFHFVGFELGWAALGWVGK